MRRGSWLAVTMLLTMTSMFASPAIAGKYNTEEKTMVDVSPEEDKALVYIVRSSRTGGMIYIWTFVDEQFAGVTRGPGYTYIQVDPGPHMIWSRAENVSAMNVELEAGETYYVKQAVLPGFGKARTRVELLDEEKGRKALKKAKKLSTPTPEASAKAAEFVDRLLDKAKEKAARGDDD